MADNPILNWSDTVVYERDRLPNVTSGEDIQNAANSVVGLYQGVEQDRMLSDLDEADAATARDQELQATSIEDAIQKATADVDPEFAEAVRQISRFQLMKDQGIGDQTALNVRREHTLRAWTARHPEWAGDLLKVANEHLNGSTVGEAIAKARGPANPLDNIETHARQLGVDMSLRYSDPVAFSLDYVKRSKLDSQLKTAQSKLQLLETQQAYIAKSPEMQTVLDGALTEMIGGRLDKYWDGLLTMADSASTAGEAEVMNAIRQGARKEYADAVAFVVRQSGGTITADQAAQRVPIIGQLKSVIDASDPADLASVINGIKGVREAEIEGWYAAHPGAAVSGEKLRILGQLGNSFPGLTGRKEQLTEAARLSSYFLGMDSRTLNSNAPTGVALPRRDSLGITQDATAAARSTYNATVTAVRNVQQMPQEADRHMLNLADSWESGERPSKRALQLATEFMSSDAYRDTVKASGVTPAVRAERAAKITQMVVGELVDDHTTAGIWGWTKALSGIKWQGDKVVVVPGKSPIDEAAVNAEASPRLTQMVKAVAHASGLDYEQATARLWPILNEWR